MQKREERSRQRAELVRIEEQSKRALDEHLEDRLEKVAGGCREVAAVSARYIRSHRSPFCPVSIWKKMETNLGKNASLSSRYTHRRG